MSSFCEPDKCPSTDSTVQQSLNYLPRETHAESTKMTEKTRKSLTNPTEPESDVRLHTQVATTANVSTKGTTELEFQVPLEEVVGFSKLTYRFQIMLG